MSNEPGPSFKAEGDLYWNGNEIVFKDKLNCGVAGLAPGSPDTLGQKLVDRWNCVERIIAAQTHTVMSMGVTQSNPPSSPPRVSLNNPGGEDIVIH